METSVKMTIAEFFNNATKSGVVYNNDTPSTLNSVCVETLEKKKKEIEESILVFDDIFQLVDFAKFVGIPVKPYSSYKFSGYPSYNFYDDCVQIQIILSNSTLYKSVDVPITEENFLEVYGLMQDKLIEYYKQLEERITFITTTKIP